MNSVQRDSLGKSLAIGLALSRKLPLKTRAVCYTGQ